MRLLVDNALSPTVAQALRDAGHDAVHLRDLGRQHDSDDAVFALADAEARTVVSADTDFGTLLAQREARRPSVVLLRRLEGRRPLDQAALLVGILARVAADLDAGAVVVVDSERVPVRPLPIP